MSNFAGQWFTIALIDTPIGNSGKVQQLLGIPGQGNVYTINGTNIVSAWNINSHWQDDWAQRADDMHDAYQGGRPQELAQLIKDAQESMPDFSDAKAKAIAVYDSTIS